MMAQPQSAQGCAVCGAPSDPLDETRAKRAVCWGEDFGDFGLSKSLAKPRSGGEIPSRARPSSPVWLSHAIQALDDIQPRNDVSSSPWPSPTRERDQSADHRDLSRAQRLKRCRGKGTNKTAAQGLRFLLAQPVGLGAKKATGLRHGASWSCRRCLPARCPSR